MKRIESILISADEIQKRVHEVAAEISAHYQGKELHVVGILNGAFIFLGDLVKQIEYPCFVHFMRISSYTGTSKAQGIQFWDDLELEDKDVLIVEDIVDTGDTLKKLITDFQAKKVRSLRVCSFLLKKMESNKELTVDWSCFSVADEWVVGYGLDVDGYYRNLPYVAIFKNGKN